VIGEVADEVFGQPGADLLAERRRLSRDVDVDQKCNSE
jgi:hypothetical protein